MTGFLRQTLERAAALALTLFVASVLVFALLDVLPGDSAAYMMGLNPDPAALSALRSEMGLDAPAWQRYLNWLLAMLRGDFGVSYTYRVPVADLMAERAALSIPLALMALVIAGGSAVGLALLSLSSRCAALRNAIIGFGHLGVAAPPFVVALLLVQVFASWLGWTSAGGFPGWNAGALAIFGALILPAVALALPQAAILLQVVRTAMLETAKAPYVTTARARGLSRWRVLSGHILPNALIPILTILGLQFTFLLAGAVIIENVFYLPGLGRLVLQAVAQRDLIVVRGVVMLLVFAAVLTTFAVDILYALADPRVRTGSQP